MKSTPKKTLCVLFVFVVSSFVAQARPMTPEDLGYALEKHHRKVLVRPDGTMEVKQSMGYRLLSDKGVQAFSVYQIRFDKNREEVADLSVRIQSGGREFNVDPKDIEEKTIFAGLSGYDETRTKVIPLPAIAVGARVFLDYTARILKPGFPGLAMGRFVLQQSTDVEDYYLELVLPKDMAFRIHDPAGAFADAIANTEQGELRKIVVIKNHFKTIASAQEPSALLPRGQVAWIEYTNAKDFVAAGKVARQGFLKSLNEELPEAVSTLFDDVSQLRIPSDAEGAKRLAEVLQILVRNFRYFADWRTVDGGFVPRSLSEIARTGYGDCKDFAVLVVKAAALVGLSGDVALVFRSTDNYQALDLPSLAVFNHAIARIKKPKSEGFWWVDGTNLVEHVGLVPQDISGRKALVLADEPVLVDIPEDPASLTEIKSVYDFDVSSSPHLKIAVSQTESGQFAWSRFVDLLGASEQFTKEYVLQEMLGLSLSEVQDFELNEFEKKEREPFAVRAKASVVSRFGIRRAGDLRVLPTWTFGSAQDRIMDVLPGERMSDLNLGFLRRVEFVQKLKAGSFSELVGVPKSCDLKSPWLDYRRNVEKATGLVITDNYEVKQSRVLQNEIKTPEFLALQEKLKDCLEGVAVVFK